MLSIIWRVDAVGKETKVVDYKELQKDDPLGIKALGEAAEVCDEYFNRVEYAGSRGETAQKAMVEFGELFTLFDSTLKQMSEKLTDALHKAGLIFELSDELISERMKNGKTQNANSPDVFFNIKK